jgi:hypothetical protein
VTLPPRATRLIPWIAAASASGLLFVPFIPLWAKALFVAGLVVAALVLRHQAIHSVDHAGLAEARKAEVQALLDAAMAARGDGHALHLRSGDGTDDAVEGMLEDALAGTGTPILGIAAGAASPEGPQPARRIDWHQAVPRMLDRARLIVMTPLDRADLRWEVSALRSRGLFDRAIFRMPPATDAVDAAARWEAARKALLVDGLHLPPYNPAGRWFRMCPDRGAPLSGAPYGYGRGLRATIENAHEEALPEPYEVSPFLTTSQAA